MPDTQKILVVQPNWVGDAVMATPTLRAIRALFPDAHIAYMMKRYVKPLYTGLPWADQLITYRSGKTTKKAGKGLFDLASRLRSARPQRHGLPPAPRHRRRRRGRRRPHPRPRPSPST